MTNMFINITIDKQIVINTTKSYYAMHLEKELYPYVIVENKAYVTNVNMGISVKDVVREFSLASVEYYKDTEFVKITMPVGLWDYIKDLPSLQEATIFKNNLNYIPPHNDIIKASPKMINEYSYQREAVVNMLKYRNGILEAGPGSGKTLMGLTLASLKGKSVLWINDRIDLAKQAHRTAIELLGLDEKDCGLLQGDNENITKYTFTTIQKLTKVLNRGFNDPLQKLTHWDIIVIDECHHAIGSYNSYNTYFQVLNEVSYNHVYGVTATVERIDGNEHLVYSLLGPVRHKVESKIRTMPAKVISKNIKIDTPEKVYEGMVNMYTQKAMPHKVDEWLLFHDDYIKQVEVYIDSALKEFDKVLIVSPRVAGAQMWSDYLDQRGIQNFLVYGAIKKRDRLYTDKVIVATLDLIKEGFDMVDLECILVLSRSLHKQIRIQVIGRSERFHSTKKDPKVYLLHPVMNRFEKPKLAKWKELDINEFVKR